MTLYVNNTPSLSLSLLTQLNTWFQMQNLQAGLAPGSNATAGVAPHIYGGTGSPQGVVTGVAGDYYFRVDGAAGSYIYVCTGTTNWSDVV